ncbi:MAG TPA: hypothetical protein VNO23_01710 [Candidatus Binatia bacterium]|nr:hypothetical protein [Candidatus Binatia bacterium]
MRVVDNEPDFLVTHQRLLAQHGRLVTGARATVGPPAVLVVTGFASAETRRQAPAAGAAVDLTKPFPISRFTARVDELLADRCQRPTRAGPGPQ